MECIKCKTQIPDGAIYCCICGKKQATEPRKHKKRANGTGNITKLSGSRAKPWLARKSGVCIGTYATRNEAQKALERLADTEVTDRFNLTFKQVHSLWLPEHKREIGEYGIGSYKTAFGNCKELHDRRFRSLRHSDFQNVIIRLENKGLSKSSCEKVVQLFGQLSDWAIREGIQTINYAKYVTIAAKQKTKGNVFTANDIQAIQKSQNPAKDIALILIATGCRGNELFSVKLCDCEDQYFISGSKTDAGKNRIIAIAPIGLASYQAIRTEANGQEKLIAGYKGNKTYTNYAKREFKELMKEIGRENYTPYDCRHTFITMATRAHIDPQFLRRQVGHADLSTTDKYYTHLDKKDIVEAICSVDLSSGL